ncbi:MAG: hypothetical protein AAFN27_22950 [Pseudomonadota bacterium]
MPKLTQDRVLGLVVLAIGLFITFYWAAADSETGLVERVRGRSSIGDALAPTVAGTILILSGLWLCLSAMGERRLSLANLTFLASLVCALGVALGLMRWAGPALAELATGADYRPLRDTAPWKYAGFILGGVMMITALIYIVERRWHWSRIVIAVVVTLALALFYDLPFEDLLLPPNGDV